MDHLFMISERQARERARELNNGLLQIKGSVNELQVFDLHVEVAEIHNLLSKVREEEQVDFDDIEARINFVKEGLITASPPDHQDIFLDKMSGPSIHLESSVKDFSGFSIVTPDAVLPVMPITGATKKDEFSIVSPDDVYLREMPITGATNSKEHEVFIGLEEFISRIHAELLPKEPSLATVIIHGMGGLGKTALARKIYNSADASFVRRVWVTTSQNQNSRDLLQLLIESLDGDLSKEKGFMPNSTDLEMKRHLQSLLYGQRYLVVIDDVWDRQLWSINGTLREAFPENLNGSRVIITTPNRGFSPPPGKVFVHNLRFLTPKESWDLFCTINAENVPAWTPAMEILARELVQACCGLPLAVTLLPRLSESGDIRNWFPLKKNFWKQMKTRDDGKISKLLSLSYNDLHPLLRPYFLYMAMFPQGNEFDVEKLIHMWMAEEFVADRFAENHINKLVDRHLIQVTRTFWGRPAKCKLHDMHWCLATDWAEEVSFFDIFDPYMRHSESLSSRRHAIHGHLQNYISLAHPKTDLHTLLLLKQHREYFIETEELLFKFMRYKFLKVLNLQDINLFLSQLLDYVIGMFLHLRFLGLANTSIRKLPWSIASLSDLETLDASRNYNCIVPLHMSFPSKLRHLHGHFKLSGTIRLPAIMHTLKGISLKQLISFQNKTLFLEKIDLYYLEYDDISSFRILGNELETLTIISANNALPEPGFLSGLSNLQYLQNLWLDGSITSLWEQPHNYSLPWVTRLILSNSNLQKDPMEAFRFPPGLNELELMNSYKGTKMVFRAGSFPQLKVLRLSKMRNLRELIVEEGAMPRLAGLGIYGCDNLQKPTSLEHVPVVAESDTEYYLKKHHYSWKKYAEASSEPETDDY